MEIKLKELRLNNPIPLQSVIDVSSAMNSIFKESYRNLAGLSKRQRTPELNLGVAKFRNGSLEFEILAEILKHKDSVPQIAFILANIPPETVLKTGFAAIRLWKKLFDEEQKGNTVINNISIVNSPNSLIAMDGGTINVTAPVLYTACNITQFGEKLVSPLRTGQLESVKMNQSGEELLLTEADVNCFRTATQVDLEVKEIIGQIIDFSKKTKAGTFEYIEDMKRQTKKFIIPDDDLIVDTIDKFKRSACKMYCHEHYLPSLDGSRAVVKLQVIKIDVV